STGLSPKSLDGYFNELASAERRPGSRSVLTSHHGNKDFLRKPPTLAVQLVPRQFRTKILAGQGSVRFRIGLLSEVSLELSQNRSPTSSLHRVPLTAPRAVLTKRQHAIQFDQPTFSRPESFGGLNLGHANESCHGVEPHTKSEKVFKCVEAGIHSAARKEGWGFPEGFEVVMGSEKNNNGREDPPTIIFGVHLEDTDSPTMRDLGWGEIRIRRKKFPDYEFTMSSNIKTNAKVTIGKESDSMMFKESGNGVVVVVGRELKKSANENKNLKSDKCCVIACFEIADHDSLEKLHRKRWIPETVEALELWDR
ncbi:hypothetical protein EV361DRAFT_870343, partial [Lentinula raphanica]